MRQEQIYLVPDVGDVSVVKVVESLDKGFRSAIRSD
jgi:hypothetical protein